MIKSANFLLSKAMPIRAAETAQLEQLVVKSNQVHPGGREGSVGGDPFSPGVDGCF